MEAECGRDREGEMKGVQRKGNVEGGMCRPVLASHCLWLAPPPTSLPPISPALLGRSSFASLLRDMGSTPGLERMRFVTSHPRYMSERVIDAVAETPALCEMFHIPFQVTAASPPMPTRSFARAYLTSHVSTSLSSRTLSRGPLAFGYT